MFEETKVEGEGSEGMYLKECGARKGGLYSRSGT